MNREMKEQEKIIKRILKTGGYLFPETVQEVIEYEKKYGTTEIVLPEELRNLDFLNTLRKKGNKAFFNLIEESKFAAAARGNDTGLPTNIQEQILNDIKNYEDNK
ncbi:MAG: hypothetical protein ACK5M0_09390 [Bacteroidales bacterium]